MPSQFIFNKAQIHSHNISSINKSALKDKKLIVEVFEIDTELIKNGVEQHQFKLTIYCTECKINQVERHFTTFPSGSYGRFIFKFRDMPGLLSGVDDVVNIGIKLELISDYKLKMYSISGNILIE